MEKTIPAIIHAYMEKYNETYPVPDIEGKSFEEAEAALKKAGFCMELKNPAYIPDAQDIVFRCFRKTDTLRTVLLLPVPDIKGLPVEEAAQRKTALLPPAAQLLLDWVFLLDRADGIDSAPCLQPLDGFSAGAAFFITQDDRFHRNPSFLTEYHEKHGTTRQVS